MQDSINYTYCYGLGLNIYRISIWVKNSIDLFNF